MACTPHFPSSNGAPALSTHQEYRMNDMERVGLLNKFHLPAATNGKCSQLIPSYTIRRLLKFTFTPTSTIRRYSHKVRRVHDVERKEKKSEKKNKEMLCSCDRDRCSPFVKEYLAIVFAVYSCLVLSSSEGSAGRLLFYTYLKTLPPQRLPMTVTQPNSRKH